MPTDPVKDPDRSQPRSGKRHPRANSTKDQPADHPESIEPAVNPLDPTLLDHADMRTALDARDIGAVYRLLKHAGVTQRQRVHPLPRLALTRTRQQLTRRATSAAWRSPASWRRKGSGLSCGADQVELVECAESVGNSPGGRSRCESTPGQ
jgi:hypothetical protein